MAGQSSAWLLVKKNAVVTFGSFNHASISFIRGQKWEFHSLDGIIIYVKKQFVLVGLAGDDFEKIFGKTISEFMGRGGSDGKSVHD